MVAGVSGEMVRREAALIERAYATLIDNDAWAGLMADLAACLPDGRATLTLHDQVAGAGAVPLAHGLGDDFQQRYNAHFGRRNPWLSRVGERPVGVGERSEARLPFAALEKTEFYQDFLRDYGIRSGVGITIGRQGGRHFLMSVVGGARESEHHDQVAAMLTRLAPHFTRVLELSRRRPYRALTAGALGGGLDAAGVAALCVGAGRRLVWANAAAEALLAGGDGIGTSVAGQVRLTDPAAMAALDAALTPVGTPKALAPVSLKLDGGAASARQVTICRLELGVVQVFFSAPAALVIVTPAAGTTTGLAGAASGGWLARLAAAGLTERERVVALDLAAGLAPAEIAAARGVSVATVRSHLKQIYAKLGVRRQAELVALAGRG